MMLKILIWVSFLIAPYCISANSDELPWINGQHGLELDLVRPFLPQNPVILEAGGHYGEDTVIMCERWPQSTIYSFEPCPDYFAKLEKAVANLPNVHVYPYGLFTTTGYYTFNVSRNLDGASSFLKDNNLPVINYNDYQISVFCKNLDEWADENGINYIDYMWLDIEGAELYVLMSAPQILETVRAISCELNYKEFRQDMPHFEKVNNYLNSQGFTLYKIWGSENWQATGVYIRSSLL